MPPTPWQRRAPYLLRHISIRGLGIAKIVGKSQSLQISDHGTDVTEAVHVRRRGHGLRLEGERALGGAAVALPPALPAAEEARPCQPSPPGGTRAHEAGRAGQARLGRQAGSAGLTIDSQSR
jgi:hypothetical protein